MPLNAKERARYELCKETIKEKMQGSIDLGMALREIRVGKLYREDYDTFDDFLLKEYQLSRSYASRLIGFVEVKESIADSKHADAIVNEAQARALSAVPEENRAKVLKEAVKSGEVTAQTIKAAAAEVVPDKPKPLAPKPEPSKKKPALDAMGYRVPEALVGLWNRGSEAQALMTQISRMKMDMERLQKTDDPLWAEVSFTGLIADLSKVYTHLKSAKPFAVCTKCQGLITKNCPACKGRGLISEFAYNTFVTREVKAMREKAIKLQPAYA